MSEHLAGEGALERRRTGWDIVLGIAVVVAGAVVLGHVATASLVSILFTGWMALIGGIVLVVGAIVGWRSGARRSDLLAGVLFVILGIGFLRNPGAGLLVLTLLAGSLLVLGGVARVAAAFEAEAPRAMLFVNGIVTFLLGLLILLRWPVSALWLLGTIIGVQLLIDGVTLAVAGRLRPVRPPRAITPPPGPASPEVPAT